MVKRKSTEIAALNPLGNPAISPARNLRQNQFSAAKYATNHKSQTFVQSDINRSYPPTIAVNTNIPFAMMYKGSPTSCFVAGTFRTRKIMCPA